MGITTSVLDKGVFASALDKGAGRASRELVLAFTGGRRVNIHHFFVWCPSVFVVGDLGGDVRLVVDEQLI